MATKKEFNRIKKISKRLKVIFARDRFQYETGTEEYIVRAVEEAAQHSVQRTGLTALQFCEICQSWHGEQHITTRDISPRR